MNSRKVNRRELINAIVTEGYRAFIDGDYFYSADRVWAANNVRISSDYPRYHFPDLSRLEIALVEVWHEHKNGANKRNLGSFVIDSIGERS